MYFYQACFSDAGPVREKNQDALLVRSSCSEKGNLILAVLCDGVGGLTYGELASAHTVRRLNEWFDEKLLLLWAEAEENCFAIGVALSLLIQDINSELWLFGQEYAVRLGTTLTLFLVLGSHYYLLQVGDSRCYRVGGGKDVQEFLLTGDQVDSESGKLLQCMGGSISVDPVLESGVVREGDLYLLCCDGFWRKHKEGEFAGCFAPDRIGSAETLAEKLGCFADRLTERGETDNISAVAICFEERGAEVCLRQKGKASEDIIT